MSSDDIKAQLASGDPAAMREAADALDKAGRALEATDLLARAASQGSAQAKVMVGTRLLIGRGAPTRPGDGIGLIAEGATEGNGDGLILMATLLAHGAFVRQDWAAALDALRRAAEAGAPQARAQLAVLSDDAALKAAASEAAPPVELWQRLQRSIDIGTWLSVPPGREINADPRVGAIEHFMPNEVCTWLIERAAPRLHRAEIYNAARGGGEADQTRTNSQADFNLVETDVVNALIQARMAAALGVPFNRMESFAVLHYSPGEEFAPHYDFVDPDIPDYAQEIARNGERVVTFLIYLNDDYEGGETEFTRLGIAHKGKTGEGLYFSNALADGKPDTRAMHAGRPPTRGEKWIVSQFVRNRPMIPGAT